MHISILGTRYDVKLGDLNNSELEEADGLCKLYDKEILIRKKEYMCGDSDIAKERRLSQVVRHEVIHALAEESGVSYGENEELVDWIARMMPKANVITEIIIGSIREE